MLFNFRLKPVRFRSATPIMLALLVGVLWLSSSTTAAEPNAPEVKMTTASLLSKVELLRDELELIRLELGHTAPAYIEIGVNGAVEREVYSHIYTLSEKAHRLAFEFTGKPDRPLGILLSPDTSHDDTLIVLEDAMQSIVQVKQALKIKMMSTAEQYEQTTNSSTLLRSVIQANREINGLLYRGYSPTEVYHEISIALNFANGLLRNTPKKRITPPRKIPGIKTASDVYYQLIDIFNELTLAAKNSGLEPMRLKARSAPAYVISASDTYDISRVLISELAFMYSLLNDPGSLEDPDYPEQRKLPSQLFAHAERLRAKVRKLIHYSAKNPDWLNNKSAG